MHEAFWNGLLDVRWEDAPLGPETTRLVLRLRECGYAERTCRDYGHAVIHLGRVLREETGNLGLELRFPARTAEDGLEVEAFKQREEARQLVAGSRVRGSVACKAGVNLCP